jgi:hypothetical protein
MTNCLTSPYYSLSHVLKSFDEEEDGGVAAYDFPFLDINSLLSAQ